MSDYIDGFMDGCGEASANPEAGEDNWHSIAETYDAARSDRDPEQPSVDWLDPARESCLIDGVRYEKRWALDDGEGNYWTCASREHAEWAWATVIHRAAEGDAVDPPQVERIVKILVPSASPEPDKETP